MTESTGMSGRLPVLFVQVNVRAVGVAGHPEDVARRGRRVRVEAADRRVADRRAGRRS